MRAPRRTDHGVQQQERTRSTDVSASFRTAFGRPRSGTPEHTATRGGARVTQAAATRFGKLLPEGHDRRDGS